MTAKIPHGSGVYKIRCITTGKIYVGSATDLRDRWAHHRQSLRRGNHHNIHLQSAWNKYGEEQFVFEVLDLVDSSELLSAEQQWIEHTHCAERNVGFNIFDTAGSPGDTFAQTWEGFIDPQGNEVTITNLYQFCREHNLDWPSMHRLAMGKSKLKSYKGWIHKNSIRQRDYVKTYDGFIDPDGNPLRPITNLAAFCREHGLDKTHMVAVAHGRIYSHRGWTYDNGREHGGYHTYTGFVNPQGHREVISNLREYCRQHDLDAVHMHELISGKRKSHKGWTWSLEDE